MGTNFYYLNGQHIGKRSAARLYGPYSSFIWAIEPPLLAKRIIRDEYGRRYTPKQFEAVLDECPIRYFDLIGKEFS